MAESPFSLQTWVRSIGLTSFEREAAENIYFGRFGVMPHQTIEIQDALIPPFDSCNRTSFHVVATFNLVATIIGGGVLSIPLAFEKCGILLATVLMVLAALITDRSLYLLCLCARQSGVRTYGEVGRIAFGNWMEWALAGLLFVFLGFVLVAYMVLIRDIWTPIVQIWLPAAHGNFVLLGALCLMSPFLVQRSLYLLRYNCYVGFVSTAILCIALCHHAGQKLMSDEPGEIRIGMSSFGDALFAFPLITLSFLSSFNILPIQAALVRPSKQRVRSVIHHAVLVCFALMYVFGLAGYIFAGSTTEGNVLLNLNQCKDVVVLMGRVGCGTTILLATAMILLPCRQNALELFDLLFLKRQACDGLVKDICDDEVNADNQTCSTLLTQSTADRSTDLYIPNEQTQLLPLIDESPPPLDVYTCAAGHYGSTLLIVGLCYLGAVATSGVAVVWSLCGSTMAFLIAFILPTACYIRIQTQQPRTEDSHAWLAFSWCLLVFSILATVACSIQAGIHLFGFGG